LLFLGILIWTIFNLFLNIIFLILTIGIFHLHNAYLPLLNF
jgi:hypothetical protein